MSFDGAGAGVSPDASILWTYLRSHVSYDGQRVHVPTEDIQTQFAWTYTRAWSALDGLREAGKLEDCDGFWLARQH